MYIFVFVGAMYFISLHNYLLFLQMCANKMKEKRKIKKKYMKISKRSKKELFMKNYGE
jgi:hypothetical protein